MPHRILIADDDPQVLDVLEEYLNRLGYDVLTAPDGQSAIDVAIGHPVDLAIIDVRMPGLSGSETYTRLKNLCPDMEAVFFTADAEFEHDRDFLRFALPPERVLTKPLRSLSNLTRLIIGILGPPSA